MNSWLKEREEIWEENYVIIKSPGGNTFKIIKPVGNSNAYRLYVCVQENTNLECILQIASEKSQNDKLQRMAFILRFLKENALKLEEQYAKIKTNPDSMLNYQFGFPEIVKSFIYPEQDNRWINILAFENIKEISQLIPLDNILTKDHQRVDLKTSVWIMGKLLKIIDFIHGQGVSIGNLKERNILIEPEQHYVMIFDWLSAEIHLTRIPLEIRRQEISEAAKSVIKILGINPEEEFIPNDIDEKEIPYLNHLFLLAQGKQGDAHEAHRVFYETVDSLWERKYHPFTTKPL